MKIIFVWISYFLIFLKPSLAQNWEKQETQAYKGKQDDIFFINQKLGWYINGAGKVFKTRDGGKKWDQIFEKKGTFFRCLTFLDSLHGFAGNIGTDYFPNVTDTIPLYETKDGGNSWIPVSYKGPTVKGFCAIDVVKEQFINQGMIDYKSNIYCVGRVGSPAYMMTSLDDGKTFNSTSLNDVTKMLFDIKMLDKNNGFACGASDGDITKSNALILKTQDGGKTWKKVFQSKRPFETSWKISFPTPKFGYATIQSYNPDTSVQQLYIAKTENGGKSWKEIPLTKEKGNREFGIGFTNLNHGWVGTLTSGFETLNGGKTWKKVEMGRAVNKIRIINENNKTKIFAIGLNIYSLDLENEK